MVTPLPPLRLLDDEFELQPTSVDLPRCYDREYGMDEERRYKLKGDYILSNMTSAGPLRTFDMNGQLHDHVTASTGPLRAATTPPSRDRGRRAERTNERTTNERTLSPDQAGDDDAVRPVERRAANPAS